MKKLGIIGGLGPMATAYFMQLVIEMTKAETDQQHIEMLVHNCPSIPDRTQYILGQSKDNPVPAILDIGNEMTAAGVDYIAIPCITAHCFHKELQNNISVPVINAIAETTDYLEARGIRKVGVMATDGTVQTGLFTTQMQERGMECIYPSKENQRLVMDIIYNNVKAGKPIEMDKFRYVSRKLFADNAKVILLGCTELSMAKRDEKLGAGFLDVMEVLAKCSVERCGALKEDYQELITGGPYYIRRRKTYAKSCIRLSGHHSKTCSG